jgi:hypothetical protein
MTSATQNIENQPELAPVNEDRSAWIIAGAVSSHPAIGSGLGRDVRRDIAITSRRADPSDDAFCTGVRAAAEVWARHRFVLRAAVPHWQNDWGARGVRQ